MDDSDFDHNVINESSSINESEYKCNDPLSVKTFSYDSSSNNIVVNSETINVCSGKNELNRDYSYEIELSPKQKYVNVFFGETNDILNNDIGVNMGYKYDIDMTTVAGTYPSFYTFTKLGEENKIYEYFKDIDPIASFSSYPESGKNYSSKLSRVCNYNVINELTKCDPNDCKLSVLYRIVDTNNIDPADRLNSNLGFKNWNDERGKVVMKKIETDDTYNPDNLQYSFTLDSVTIKKIREYNDGKNYSDFIGYECTDGNECKSTFIKSAYDGTGIFDTSF